MVGIVLVSHSRPLAQALVVMARQMVGKDIPVAIGAGIGEGRQELGTDALEIAEAIRSVYSPDGVLVIMDLGSALLSAEMAVDLLPREYRDHVVLCAAPLVEGAIAAAVQASLGSDLVTVRLEAQKGLMPKLEHFQLSPAGVEPESSLELEAAKEKDALSITLTLTNEHGLHARPAARFVQVARSFNVEVQVKNLSAGKGPASARSLTALAMLNAVRGDEILLTAWGREAESALAALKHLVLTGFGAESAKEIAQLPSTTIPGVWIPPSKGSIQATPISAGITIGPVYRYFPTPLPVYGGSVEDPETEWHRFQEALEKVKSSIHSYRTGLAGSPVEGRTAIFEALLLILEDPELLDQVRDRIFNKGQNAAQAWQAVIIATVDRYENLADAYLQQRSADIRDLGNQVLMALSGEVAMHLIELPGKVILCTEEITPSELALLKREDVLGIITTRGGVSSHSAILTRSFGIPAVSGVDWKRLGLQDGTEVALDGLTGALWIEPDLESKTRLNADRQQWLEQRQLSLIASREPAITRDGHKIEVAANVGNLAGAQAALENGAEGIGVLRTEFLYLSRPEPPDEQEQVAHLREICQAMANRPVIIRTLDAGGDKDLPYLHLPTEANPFLGLRAIRVSLKNPDLFTVQMRAILRVGAEFPVMMMFPMVTNLEEVIASGQILQAAHQALESGSIPHLWPIKTGIMVEVPSVALLSDLLASWVDFFSIGTNDLTQYALAIERGNASLTQLGDALHPAILRLIRQVVEAAHQKEKWVGVCGEIAGDPLAAPVLIGLGVDELSINPAEIPQIKAVIRDFAFEDAQRMATQALDLENAAAVRRQASSFLAR